MQDNTENTSLLAIQQKTKALFMPPRPEKAPSHTRHLASQFCRTNLTLKSVQGSISISQEQLMSWKRKLDAPAFGRTDGSSANNHLQAASQKPQPTAAPVKPAHAAETEGKYFARKHICTAEHSAR